jgi:hypothetical protein
MPDNEDYAVLGDLLSRPSTWTPTEAAAMCFALRESRENLAAVHLLDHHRRASLAALVDEIEAAVRISDSASG